MAADRVVGRGSADQGVTVRKKLSIVGLVLFVLLDIALIGLAFRRVDSPPRSSGSADEVSSATDTGSATPSSPVATDNGPLVFASMLGNGTLLRASRGDCTKEATPAVQVSASAQKGSKSRPVSGLRQVLATGVTPQGRLTIVGLDHSCKLARFASKDMGKTWTRRTGDGRSWHVLADAKAVHVHGPDGPRQVPCSGARLPNPQAGLVRLLCPDGSIYGTDDDGQTWPLLGRLEGAFDVAFTSSGSGFAVAHQPGCRAAVLQTNDSGLSWTQVECLPGRKPRTVAAAGSLVAAQVGPKLFVSRDGGASWPKPGG